MRNLIKKSTLLAATLLLCVSQTAPLLAKENLSANKTDKNNVVDNYPWKGMIQGVTTVGLVTLSHVDLNGHGRMITVKPGETIQGKLRCSLNKTQASSVMLYRVVLGIKGVGGQASVYNSLGAKSDSAEQFTLTAPKEPGLYQVRFKLVEKLSEKEALDSWFDSKGREPEAKSTIATILVS
jgi:hypothetical protein